MQNNKKTGGLGLGIGLGIGGSIVRGQRSGVRVRGSIGLGIGGQ